VLLAARHYLEGELKLTATDANSGIVNTDGGVRYRGFVLHTGYIG
jgi:hypothetical protein